MRLTELENAVLGVVWRRGPCSAYLIKREFDTSPSASWSASAGAIYPLVKKLAAAGLLTSEEQRWGSRKKTLLALSRSGRTALERWVAAVPHELGPPTPDPIRTRAFFLDVLSEDQRARFLAESETVTRLAIHDLKSALAAIPDTGSKLELLATSGALFQLRARLRWIRHLAGAAERAL